MKCLAAWLGLAAMAGFMGTAGCNRQADPAQAAGPPPPPLVTLALATARNVPIYLDAIGTGAASDSVTITPQVSGPITERHFDDGGDIQKGQLLFMIDPRPYQAQLDLAQAQLASSNAALDLATIQLKRYDDVKDSRAISQSDYDLKKNAVDVAKAQIDASQAAIETAKLNLEYCSIHAPINGRAGRRLADVGNLGVAMQTPLLSIQKLDPAYVYFTVAEHDLPEVQKEMASGTLKTLVRLPSETVEKARQGELTFLDNAVQAQSGTVSLRASVPNADRHFWPGQFVDVRLVLSVKNSAVLIPNQCTQISQKGPFVYVIGEDDTSELRNITLGQTQGDQVVVTSGVKAGERVVLTGQMMLQPGGKVRLDSDSSTQPSASDAASEPASDTPSGNSTSASNTTQETGQAAQ